MKGTERVEAYLRTNKVPYQLHHHPLAYTADRVAASEHISGKLMAKVVLAFVDKELVMLVLSSNHSVNTISLGQLMEGRPVRLAHESEFAPIFSDCEVGAMPPFGPLYNVPVFVDKALTEQPVIYFQAGTHTDTISMRYSDYQKLVHLNILNLSVRSTAQFTT